MPGLAPLVAGGAGAPGLIFACFFGALFGLAGGLLGTSSEAQANTNRNIYRGALYKVAGGTSAWTGAGYEAEIPAVKA